MICRYVADSNGELGYRCRQEGLLFYAHRSFETGKQAANIALLVECILLALFYTYTALMRKDFTKSFVVVTLAPFALRAALLVIHTAIIHAMQFPDMKM
ncbi:unnamed protein product [Heligmosomoides polygyrus]|uniref:Post-GPI attachment to proteins factor 3 n=1 Tax=Heligmosomoides polygyrus TaxID=6339 RepID=A0A183G6E7_HELPZ|nr:unnamed protein product [Heligmosomoides polygyrus]